MTMMRKLLPVVLAAACASAAGQGYPSRPIKVVVPVPAGGYYDLIARTVGRKLTEALGQPVVVENRTGAAGIIGSEFAARSAPDGYTILVSGIGPLAIFQSLYPKLPYDTLRDFAPIIYVSSVPNIVVVHPSVTVNSIAELIALARAKPGELSYASNGSGTSQHLSMEMFASAVGAKLNHVPFKGSAPAITAMLGGQTPVAFAVSTDVLPHVRAGKLRPLAVTSARRIAALPDVPTMHEAGVANYESTAWFGYLAPVGAPREIISRLNVEIGRVLEMPEVRERLAPGGLGEMGGGPPERFTDLIRSEIAKWAKVVKDSGARPD